MYAVEFKNITKKFGNFAANEDISFTVKKNSVHCILGENGAGKTTLMKILFGIYKQDSGSIKLFDEEVKFKSPHDAIDKKIGMVHQHF
ncbi:MAG: ATP-binding cassette domain-containing protein, partial [Ignavibacteria bacterium]|nr:ATP-binding cassette domain-containing protein [Ignavibacteria bacterium]